MSWFLLNRNLTPLEPYDWKLSRTVLRGERGSNAPDLPGQRKFMNRFDAIQSLLGLTDKEKAQILSINQSNDPSRKYKEVWL